MALQIAKLKSYLSNLCRRFLYFSEASFFLSGDQLTLISNNILSAAGLLFGNSVAEYSFLGFLVVLIENNLPWDNLWRVALVSTARECFSAFLASFLAYATHQRIHPLIMILVTHAIFIAGMLMLLFHRQPSTDGTFFLGLVVLSADISADGFLRLAVNQLEQVTDQPTINQSEQVIDQSAVNQSEQVTDQPTVNQSEQVTDQPAVNQSEQVIDDAKKSNNRRDTWWFIARFAGAVIGWVLISTVNQSEQVTDQPTVNQLEQVIDDAKISNNRIDAWCFVARFAGAIIGGVLISRLSTSKQLYISAILVGIGCVLVYSYSIRYEVSSGDHEGEKHELRRLLKLLPLWAPFLIYYVVDAAGSAFLDYKAYLYIMQTFSGIIVSRLFDYVITKFCSKENQLVQQRIRLVKIIIGMLVCCLLCIDTWHVIKAKEKSEGSLTFILQFILLGIMKEMVKEMLGEYFCDQVPDQSLHHLEFTFNRFVEGMGRLLAVVSILVFGNWMDEEVGESERCLDNYFRTLAFMSLCALFMFVCLSSTFYLKKETEDHDDKNLEKMEEGSVSPNSSRPLESQSSPLSSSSISQSTAYSPGDESISASSEAALLPNLESAGSSANRGFRSIVERYQICHRFLRNIKERLGAKEKSS